MSALTSLVRAGGLALEPLERALADPEACMRLLRELGVDVSLSPAAHGEIAELMPIAEDLRALPDLVAALDGGGPAAVLALADRSAEIGAAIAALDGIDADDLTALPGLLSLPETWTALAAALPSHLLARQLALQSPALFAVLRLTGVCVSEGPGERPRYRLDWSALGPALADPTGAVRAAVGWGDRFSAWPLQRELALLLARYGLQVDHRPMQPAVAEAVAGAPVELPSGAESDVVLFSGTTDAGAVCELGLVLACARDGGGTVYVGNLAYGAAELAVPLGETWSLEAAGALDGLATIGVRLRPSGVALVGGDPALAASLALVGRPADPWVLLGSPDGTRLQLDGARVEVGVDGTVAEPDPYLLVAVEDGAFRLVIDLGVADSFLRGLIGGSIPEISAGGELRWGAGSGVAFGGGGLGLEVTLPIDKAAGPLHVDALTVALGGGTDSARMAATTDASLTFGPFTGMVGGIGAAVDLLPGADGVGGLRAEVAFVPPTRIGLEVDAEGVVTGGGFVDFDAASGRYAGALSLDFPADVGLDAIVVVDTRLPGDPDGWALFASLFATFPSIPLGFGFFLSGVGGLVCLNRTMDGEAIAAGLKSGAVDAILFPDDVLGEAGAIVAQLDAWFPLAEGNTVFGVAATITWGTPKVLVTGELGVMVSFPDLEIAVLGSVAMVLPEEADAVLELHMDSIGVIDVADQTVTVAASLYDSALLHTLHLSGDMALYARLGVSPYFLLSIGGYNPNFKPPAGLPPSIVAVRRMRAEVALGEDAWFALEAYVAVTSNTLQFGALAALEASSTFLATRYTARGEVGFDVLLVFSPFKFVADFHASVSVTAGDGDKELIAVSLAAHLEGPEPWYVTGRASFDFFGIDVKFELDVGGAAGAELPGRENVLSLVAAALREATAWRGVLPAGADAAAVALTEPPEVEGDVWARPDAELEAAQSIAPLGRALDRYGLYAIDGPARIDVTEVSLGGDAAADWEAVRGWFAPAQYDDMSRTEKLSAPSYEEMDAGVRFGTGAVSFAEAEATSVVPDYEVHVLDERKTRDKGALKATRPLQVAAASLVLEPGLRRGARQVTSTPAFTVAAPAWAPVDAVTGRAAGASGTYRDALAAVHADGAGLRVAPSHAIVGFHK